jgi:mono/diheme cytochrome c family protein
MSPRELNRGSAAARIGRALLLLLALTGTGALVIFVLAIRQGVGARRDPTLLEERAARQLRHLAIPRAAREQPNPEPASPEVLRKAMAHFADHCASCHGNNGKGQTDIGKHLYPRAPDMTAPETQRLSDGELFTIIKNGVRFTGMPAWSNDSPEADRDSWKLVHFIRHLPKITEAERSEMEVMNPVSPMEMQEREEEARFLDGKDEPPPASRPHAGHKH